MLETDPGVVEALVAFEMTRLSDLDPLPPDLVEASLARTEAFMRLENSYRSVAIDDVDPIATGIPPAALDYMRLMGHTTIAISDANRPIEPDELPHWQETNRHYEILNRRVRGERTARRAAGRIVPRPVMRRGSRTRRTRRVAGRGRVAARAPGRSTDEGPEPDVGARRHLVVSGV